MKKILFLCLIVLLTFLIYLGLQDRKIYYVSIGDSIINNSGYNSRIVSYLNDINKLEKYINISNNDYRITDIIKEINDNKKIDNKTIKNILIKADLLTVTLGYNDIISKVKIYNNTELYNYMDGYLNDLNILLKLLREYSKEDIILFSLYSLDKNDKVIINTLNNKIEEICDEYDITYMDISDITIKNDTIDSNSIKKLYYSIHDFIDNEIIN